MESFVGTVESGRLDELKNVPGLAVKEEGDAAGGKQVLFSANRLARAAVAKLGAVSQMQATARRDVVPVLIHVKRSDWKPVIEGLRIGSWLGRVVSATATLPAIDRLRKDPDVVSVEASRPGGISECVHSMPFVGAPTVHAPPIDEKGKGCILAVIDEGIDVLHEAFRDASDPSKSRFHAVWDQRDDTGPSPHAVDPARYTQDYGTLHSRADIDGYISTGVLGKKLDRDPSGHGTHVASIAGGSPIPAVNFPGGVAQESDLVVVVPLLSVDQGNPISIGYSKAHVDALAFIRATADKEDAPVVVNVSLGMNAGSHDGTSLLELAFDSFSGGGRDPGFVIVKSAGNEFGHDGHAAVQAFAGGVVPIEWRANAVPRNEDYLEFWFSSADDLEFTLVAPNGSRCTVDRTNPRAVQHYPNGAVSMYLTLTRFHPDNGDSQLVVLIRNNQPNGTLTVGGEWRLEITGNAVFSEGVIHGWVERDRARAVHFRTGSVNELTLSIPATARTVISVGACRSSAPLTLSDTSSRGPTRDGRRKPELTAPGVEIVAAQSGTSDGLVGNTGTSMAAPHVAGAVALLMAKRRRNQQPPINSPEPQLNAAQIQAALSQCLKSFHGRWQPGFGNGTLDIVALLKAFSS